jgi:hypothetical protein
MVFMLAALIGLLAAIGAAVWFAADARRRRAPAPRAGAIDLCCGLLTLGFMTLHLTAVVGHIFSGKGFGGEARFAYDFRFFWLILLGGVISIPGLVFVMQARRLTDGDVRAWKRALWQVGNSLGRLRREPRKTSMTLDIYAHATERKAPTILRAVLFG